MSTTRREFLKMSLAALGYAALPGKFLFSAPDGWKPDKVPNLVFGVISDTHLISSRGAVEKLVWNRNGGNGATEKGSPDKYLVTALKYFASRNVDAVMHCGDMADEGLVSEMEWTAQAWRKAFPNDQAKDGRKVEKLFVSGNHEVEAMWRVEKDYPDAKERARRVLSTDLPGHWERIWGEKYEAAWHKEVKGYHFFGRHYGEPTHDAFAAMLVDAAKKYELNKGTKPFFMVSHTANYYNFPEKKKLRKAIARYCRNGIAFFGHHHWSLANWKRIWFSTAPVCPEIQCPPCGPFAGVLHDKDESVSSAFIKGADMAGLVKQVLVVCVYDDMLVIERHDCSDGVASLGADWVVPLGVYKPHPLAESELKKAIGEPQFPKGAKLKIVSCMTALDEGEATDAGAGKKSKKVPGVKLTIPPANGNPDSRVYAYEAEITGSDDSPVVRKAVYAVGCNMGIGHEPNKGVTTLEIPKYELPHGKELTFSVKPITSLGTAGNPITANFRA